jgi:ribonuclease PH
MTRAHDRAPDALRPITITRGWLDNAMGSCVIEFGGTKVLCAASIDDSVPGWMRGRGKGWITAEYAMLPQAGGGRTPRESATGRIKGRTHEIQRLIGRSMRGVVDLGGLGGEYTLTIDCDVLQADGGTRTASIDGAYIAVVDALKAWREAGKIRELPLLGGVSAISVGVVDGRELLDLDYSEDRVAEVDMNVVVDSEGRFIEVQGTAESAPYDRARLDRMLDLALVGTTRIAEIQRTVIEEDLRVFNG